MKRHSVRLKGLTFRRIFSRESDVIRFGFGIGKQIAIAYPIGPSFPNAGRFCIAVPPRIFWRGPIAHGEQESQSCEEKDYKNESLKVFHG